MNVPSFVDGIHVTTGFDAKRIDGEGGRTRCQLTRTVQIDMPRGSRERGPCMHIKLAHCSAFDREGREGRDISDERMQ